VEVRYGKACPAEGRDVSPICRRHSTAKSAALLHLNLPFVKCWAQRRPVGLQRASQSSNIARLTFAELSKSASWRMTFPFLLGGPRGSGAVLPHCHHCPILILCRSSESGRVVRSQYSCGPDAFPVEVGNESIWRGVFFSYRARKSPRWCRSGGVNLLLL
jgi:hypothetical protein